MKCPSCGRQSDGKFCPDCGAPLKGAECRSCGTPLAAGARFCTQCGAQTGMGGPAPAAAGSSGTSNTPWLIAGGVLVAIILAVLLPMLFRDDGAPAQSAAPFANGGTGATGNLPALSGDMRENADRLFNRIMEARESGNLAQATQFYPMAIQAYQSAEPLDADGLYHLSLIQTASGDATAGLASAQRILDMSPNHLLGLGAAGEAALEAGDTAAARGFYQRFLDAYETERTQQYPEYLDHSRILPSYQLQARGLLGS